MQIKRSKTSQKEPKATFSCSFPCSRAVLFKINNSHIGHLEKLLIWGFRGLNFTQKLLLMAKDPAGAESSPSANHNTQPGLHQCPQQPENSKGVTLNTYRGTILHSEKSLRLQNECPASPKHQFSFSIKLPLLRKIPEAAK